MEYVPVLDIMSEKKRSFRDEGRPLDPQEKLGLKKSLPKKSSSHQGKLDANTCSEASSNVSLGSNEYIVPKLDDVLLGRGRKLEAHAGNKAFRDAVDSFLPRFDLERSRNGRSRLFDEIVHFVCKDGVQFLQQNELSGEWEVAPIEIGRAKVGQSLRYRQRQKKRRISDEEDPIFVEPATIGTMKERFPSVPSSRNEPLLTDEQILRAIGETLVSDSLPDECETEDAFSYSGESSEDPVYQDYSYNKLRFKGLLTNSEHWWEHLVKDSV
jgi:hypothetical protein